MPLPSKPSRTPSRRSSPQAAAPGVHYRISVLNAHAHLFAITLTIDHTTTVLLDNPPGDMRNAMGMNIRLLCRLINAVCDRTHATRHDQGATR